MFCPQCGRELPDDAKFCLSCGHKLDEQAPDGPEPKPAPPMPETGVPGEAPPESMAPVADNDTTPQVEAILDEELNSLTWLRLTVLAALVGAGFITFFNFGREALFSASYLGGAGLSFGDLLGYAAGLAGRAMSYGIAPPVLALLIAAGAFFMARNRKEQLEAEFPGQGVSLVAVGVGLGGVLMLLSHLIGGRFIWAVFCLLIAATQIFVSLILKRHGVYFETDPLEKIAFRVVCYSLLTYAAFLGVSAVGVLTGLGFLAVSLPRIFMIIAGIAGLLGVVAFGLSMILRKLDIKIG
ncbi:MAG: zinc-ribbon domain-containing protein [Candidatus Coatesbacteria bacterium]|nr:zinc-ribbon domain-containing protein [Candidatus Coatesbacteria bacterium]